MANKNNSVLITVGTAVLLSIVAAMVVTYGAKQLEPAAYAPDNSSEAIPNRARAETRSNEDAAHNIDDQPFAEVSVPDDFTKMPIDAQGAARRMVISEIHQALSYFSDESLHLSRLSDEEIIELIKHLNEQELDGDTVAGLKRVILQMSFCDGTTALTRSADPSYSADVRYDIPAKESHLTKRYIEEVKSESSTTRLHRKKLCYENKSLEPINPKALEKQFLNPGSLFGLLALSEDRTFEQVQLLSPADQKEALSLPLPIRTIVATQILKGDENEQRCSAAWPFLAQGNGPHLAVARAHYLSYGCPAPPSINETATHLFELAASYGNRQHIAKHLSHVRELGDVSIEVESGAWRQFEYGLLRDFCHGQSNIRLLTAYFRRPTNQLSPHLHQQMESRAEELEAAYGARAREHLGCAN